MLQQSEVNEIENRFSKSEIHLRSWKTQNHYNTGDMSTQENCHHVDAVKNLASFGVRPTEFNLASDQQNSIWRQTNRIQSITFRCMRNKMTKLFR